MENLGDHSESYQLETLSVILPALNEEQEIEHFLSGLKHQTHQPVQVIVVDGGSSDKTNHISSTMGAVVISGPRGRGCQIARGLQDATGDAVFVAHADMSLEPNLFERILAALNRTQAVGGAVGCRFDPSDGFLKVISLMNRIRARMSGISFGDQGQFFRRDRTADFGGFPDQKLMEDVELSIRLKKLGPPLYLGAGVTVSSRKWQKKNKIRHALLVMRLVAQYLFIRQILRKPVDVDRMYRSYYS